MNQHDFPATKSEARRRAWKRQGFFKAPISGEEAQRQARTSREFLRRILADGPRPSREVIELARAEGINEWSLRRAKRRLKIRAVKESFSSGWVWTPVP
jgi:hypothetical protein